MKIFTNTNFTGHYPVGAAALVVAKDREEAAAMLMASLKEKGLTQHIEPSSFDEVDTRKPSCVVLVDGNY